MSQALATLTLAVDGLVGSGYFLFALGLLCSALGFYFRRSAEQGPARPEQQEKKGKKKGKKGKKKDEGGPKREPEEGGSLIWGGAGFALIGIAMVLFGLLR